MKILSWLLALAYFYLALKGFYYLLSNRWFDWKVDIYYGVLWLLFFISALGVLGIGGKATRFVAFTIGILWVVYFLYLRILLYSFDQLSDFPVKIFLLVVAEISVGLLTIFCLWKNGKNI